MSPDTTIDPDKIRHILTTSDYFTNIQWANVDKTVEFRVLQLADQYKNLTLERLVEKIDLTRLVSSIVFLLRSEGLLFEHDGTLSLTQDRDKALRERDEFISTYGPYGEELGDELLEIPEDVPEEFLEDDSTEPTPAETSSPAIEDKETLQSLKERSDPQPPMIDEQSEKQEEMGVTEALESSSLGFGSKRERLRQQMKEPTTDDTSNNIDFDSLFDDALGESIEDAVSEFSDIIIESRSKGGTIPLFVDLLKENGYLEDMEDDDKILKDMAYQLLVTIVEHHPISTEEIEAKIEDSISLSLMISNLSSDGIIKQTNDYRWTVSDETTKRLRDYLGTQGEQDVEEVIDEDRELFEKYITDTEQQLVKAVIHLAYAVDKGEDKSHYVDIPEYEILNLIYRHGKMSGDEIKDGVENVLPVVVMRMLSRLEADKVIERDVNDKWGITNKLRYAMVKHIIEKELDDDTLDELVIKYATF